jgi:hypothetical protein
MSRIAPPRAPTAGLRTVELGPEDTPLLQRFCDAKPACFLAVHGEPASRHQAFEEIDGNPGAQALYRGLEDWAVAHGAQRFRLGAVRDSTWGGRYRESPGFVHTGRVPRARRA